MTSTESASFESVSIFLPVMDEVESLKQTVETIEAVRAIRQSLPHAISHFLDTLWTKKRQMHWSFQRKKS